MQGDIVGLLMIRESLIAFICAACDHSHTAWADFELSNSSVSELLLPGTKLAKLYINNPESYLLGLTRDGPFREKKERSE